MLTIAATDFADLTYTITNKSSWWARASKDCSMRAFSTTLAVLAAVGLAGGLSIFLLTTH